MLVSHVLVPPAIEAMLEVAANACRASWRPDTSARSWAMDEYGRSPRRYRVPIVVTGLRAARHLQGVYMCVRQLEEGRAEVENQYSRVGPARGQPSARRHCIARGVRSRCRASGAASARSRPAAWVCAKRTPRFDAERRFGVEAIAADEPAECIAGEVLQGLKKPHDCPAFGTRCTPERPLGAPMVSSEGACAAYYRYRQAAGQAIRDDRVARPSPLPDPDQPIPQYCSLTAAAAG